MSINHDNEYHGDINYGQSFPEDWYWMNETSDERKLEDIIDYGKGRLTSATDQQSVWYSNIHYSKETD